MLDAAPMLPPANHGLLLKLLSGLGRFILFWISVTVTVHAFAQSGAPAAEPPVPTIRVNARSVVVDVVVTDRSGHAVSGLPKDRFKIFEDGKPQTITSFEEHSGLPAASADAHAPPSTPLPMDTFSNAPAAQLTDSVNILLMDALNTTAGDQAYVHKQMVKYMASIPPGTRLGVFTLSERLRMIQSITTDTAQLRVAIARTASHPSHSALLPTTEETAVNRDAVGEISSAGGGSSQQDATAAALRDFLDQQAAFAINERIRYTLDAFEEIARYLAGVPGRKNLIWFSGSFPLCVFSNTECPYQEQVNETLDLLTRAQVAIYPIDASGLAPDAIADASAPPNHDLDFNLKIGQSSGQAATAAQVNSLSAGSTDRVNNQTTMDELAKGTGGQAVYNTNDLLGAFERDIANGARYYTVAYTPTQHGSSGRSHALKVQVEPGRYTLAYRRFYVDQATGALKAQEQAAGEDPLRRLMVQGMPDFTQLIYRAHIVPVVVAANAPRAGDNLSLTAPVTRYRVSFSVGLDGLELDGASGASHTGSIEAALVAYGREGKPLNWETRALTLNLTPQQFELARRSGIPFQLDIDAPKEAVFLRAGIFDPTSHRAGTIEIPLASVVALPDVKTEVVKLPPPIPPAPASALEAARSEASPNAITAMPAGKGDAALVASMAPVHRKSSIAFWSLPPKTVESMLAIAPDSNAARYKRLRSYFQALGCVAAQMEEIPIAGSHEHNLVCTLPGNTTDQMIVTAHYERPQNAGPDTQDWSGAVLLAMLYKALQAEPRDHTFVFAELCDDDGERQFLDSLSHAQQPVAAAIAFGLQSPGPLFYQLSWNAYLVMQQLNPVSTDMNRMDSLRDAERSKAILSSSLVKTAQVSGAILPIEQKPAAVVQNARLVLRSTDVPSILIYTAAGRASPVAQAGKDSIPAGRFDMLAAYLCALDNNLSTAQVKAR